MADPVDHLGLIIARKRLEVRRRLRRADFYAQRAQATPLQTNSAVLADVLRRGPGSKLQVIAEIKLRSPSAGEIRPRVAGELVRIARGYSQAGAAAVSVLCDGPGFGGSALDLRRVARQIATPILFKEFVLAPVQLDLARAAGASFVLLLVRVLDDSSLTGLIDAARQRGLEPVVEAADARDLGRALRTTARVIGVNARDLRTFSVDSAQAAELVNGMPADRVAVFMSGVRSQADFAKIAATRADAVLIGEGLMRHADPGALLSTWLHGTNR